MAPIQVTCDEPALADRATQWVAAAAPRAPVGLAIDIRLVNAPWSGNDPRAVLRQPGLLFYYGPPEFDVRIVWRDGLGHASIPVGAPRATVELSRDAAADPEQWLRPFLLPVALVLLRRVGWHHIHAATARDPRGRGWLIAGDAYAGKSTTAALLATRGWEVGTDDTAFLLAGTSPVAAAAWREPIALREGGLALLSRGAGLPLARRGKTGFTPEDLGGTWLERVAVDTVALAALHDGPTRLDPLPRTTAMGELLSWSRFFVLEPALAQAHLDLVARLVARARCVRLRLGSDIFDQPDLLCDELP